MDIMNSLKFCFSPYINSVPGIEIRPGILKSPAGKLVIPSIRNSIKAKTSGTIFFKCKNFLKSRSNFFVFQIKKYDRTMTEKNHMKPTTTKNLAM